MIKHKVSKRAKLPSLYRLRGMPKSEKLHYCVGCHSDFYNGNNPMGVKECWSLDNSRLVWRKKVPMWMTPPWSMPPQKVLNCCHYDGYVLVEPEVNN